MRRAQELGEAAGLPQNPYRWRVAMAGILDAQGDHAGALDLLEEAEHVFTSDFSPNVRPVPATRARLLIVRGNLTEASAWADRKGISADDDLSYVREYEHITLARLLLAQHLADLSQARRQQPSRRSQPSRAAQPALAHDQPLTDASSRG